MTVRDVMSASVISVRKETPLKEVARVLVDHGISGLPVLDAESRLVGVVSEADFLLKEVGQETVPHRRLERLLGASQETRQHRAKIGATTAAEAMTAPAITIDPGRSISAAARAMTMHHINRLVVVEHDRPVGIVSRADIVRAFVRSDEELADTIREDVLRRILWLDPESFAVQVKNGMVAIKGHVDRRSTAETVESSIAMVPGIVDVRSDVSWSVDDSKVAPATVDAYFPYSPR